MKELTLLKTCRICKSKKLFDVLDLGKQPIPNGFLEKTDLKKVEKKYPLSTVVCLDCSLMQLKYLVPPKIMFDNYLYIPSASKTRIKHFKKLAEETKQIAKLKRDSLVIDIGSNDGSLLIAFKNLDVRTLGIDPADNLVKVAALSGIETVKGYFDPKLAKTIVKNHGKARAMLATNVIAHMQDLHEVLRGAEILLEDNGIFLMQFPYLVDLLRDNLFDTIYHEHLSYFSIRSLLKLSESSDLEIFDVEKNDLDGGSIKVYWKKKKSKSISVEKLKINNILKEEEKFGINELKTYEEFRDRVLKLKKITIHKLEALKKKKFHIVGYGAAAKANVLLNYFGIDKKTIDYIVDSTPYKQGKYTPGTHIPIYAEDKIYKTNPDFVLIFAWNFAQEIMLKNKKYHQKGKFILLEPLFKVV